MFNAYNIVDEFEEAMCEYTGAPFAVAVDSCTNALFLCLKKYRWHSTIEVPRNTYVSVPMQVIHAGHRIKWTDTKWKGKYTLKPTNIIDSARYLKPGMFHEMQDYDVCLSFHYKKPLSIGRGGMILTKNPDRYDWYSRARFDGRNPEVPVHEDKNIQLGYHCLMAPETAAIGLQRLHFLNKEKNYIVRDTDPDLSKLEVFRPYVDL